MNFIDGFALSNYRSFGSEVQKIGPFSKINLFVGKNNSGKSNILRFIKYYYPRLIDYIKNNSQRNEFNLNFTDDEIHKGLTKPEIKLGLGIINNSSFVDKYFDNLLNKNIGPTVTESEADILREILQTLVDESYQDISWLLLSGNKGKVTNVEKINEGLGVKNYIGKLPRLMDALGITIRNSDHEYQIEAITKNIFGGLSQKVKIELIPDYRQLIGPQQSSFSYLFQSNNFFEGMAELQNPGPNERYKRDKFEQILRFIKEVTDNNNAIIEIPSKQNSIIVDLFNNGNFLPLGSLGTGIHEVVVLASACTLLEEHVICIEEPELHLHPLLQKKLLKYLIDNTNNQYFISTHSAHFLDYPETKIFHVSYQEKASEISSAYTVREKSFICDDLGYKPSDLFQSNCIIWVEGPSDRIYINNWIQKIDPSLIEGIHYSIMFFGGKLFTHLTAEEKENSEQDEINKFIELRKINRKIAIILDSDKKSETDEINGSKKRIIEGFNKEPGFAWISQGREIENYLPADPYVDAVRNIHPNSDIPSISGKDQFECRTKISSMNSEKERSIDKVSVAKKYVEKNKNIEYLLDLEEKISKLISFIYASNQMNVEKKSN